MSEQLEQAQEASSPVQTSAIGQEIAAMVAETSELDTLNGNPALEGDINVPDSPFWDSGATAKEETTESEAETPAVEEEVVSDVSVESEEDTQTIKFKANGEDREITLEEARKQLAMAEGSRQAFTKLDKANKRVKELENSLPDLEKKAALLDKLEEVKHDWKAIVQIATGQDPDQFLAEALRKQRILETGTDAEKEQLEKEERFMELERKLQAQAERQAEIEKRETDRRFKSEKDSLKSMLETEFFKHKFELGSDVDSNDVNEMLWQQGQRRMSQYVKKYKEHPKFQELLPQMAQKSFEEVAGKLKRLTTGSVQAKVDEAIKQKKQKAAEQAAVTSTRHISEANADDFKGLSVREIADKLVGKKKFTF
jgi:hypothetical protein